MYITHIDKETGPWDVETNQHTPPIETKKSYKNVTEVTHYHNLSWSTIYWAEGRTGPKAYCVFPYSSKEIVITFESQTEMLRFKEDLRLQEEGHARASKNTKAFD